MNPRASWNPLNSPCWETSSLMNDQLVKEFLASFDESRFPSDLLENYELMECLAHNEQAETFLIKERKTGNLRVAKCYSDSNSLVSSSERTLLRDNQNTRLPAFIGEYQNDGMLCVLREFIEGESLDAYARNHQITRDEALSICIQLCDDLAYLHSQQPPIIHRDIKPQNVVIDRSGNPRLIDFGNSRLYNESAETDTVYFGTRHFAAPEQYGFSQTDARTDIFALGVLLGWMLTGETDIKIAVPKIANQQLQRVVRKCTAFAPENRFQSALKVKSALLQVVNQSQKRFFAWLVRVAVGVTLLTLGFAIGRYTDLSFSIFNPSAVQFKEPLIEQAVRLELGKTATENITREELLNVTEIYLFGNYALNDLEAYQEVNNLMAANDERLKNGGVVSLKDLAQLKNLRVVNIAYQNISDPSPLSELEKLEQVDLKHNPIEELSSLAGLVSLKELYLFDTRISDLSPLAGCPQLESLDVGKTLVTSVDTQKDLAHLVTLNAAGTAIDSLNGIEKFNSLQNLVLGNVLDGDLSPLLSLPQLKTITLSENLRQAAETSLPQAPFEIVFQ